MALDPEFERKVLNLFEQLLDVPGAERDDWLAEKTKDDLEARLRVNAMRQAAQSDAMQTGGAVDQIDVETSPETIGAYRVIRSLGRGGMGIVYLAERQAEDFEHHVAIKVIKTGLFSESLVERFRRERQTLAQLNHPHIARLYDGGEMPDRTPYLVMEYVPGPTLFEWMLKETSTVTQKVRLFLQICEAVEYAHQNLVIHRDLTPSNILVTESGNAKLIDFGIARPQILAGGDALASSTFSGLSLTPGFSAPERLAGVEANTLVDIFSLGRILQVLLGEQAPQELRAIADKAQAPDPTNRFPTASALSKAIIGWVEHRPVEAFSSSNWYKMSKFVARQRVLVGAVVAGVLALVGGLVGTSWALNRAENERAIAVQRFAETRALSTYLIDTVVTDLEAIPGTTTIRQRIAERGGSALERLSKVSNSTLDVTAETALAYRRIGESLTSPDFQVAKGPQQALKALETAENMYRDLVNTDPDRFEFKLGLAQAITAHALRRIVLKNDPASTVVKLDESDAILASLSGSRNDVLMARLSVATARAGLYDVTSDYSKTYSHIDASIALAQSINPNTQREKFAVASALNTLFVYRGDALWYDKDDKLGALAAYQASLSPLEAPEFATDIRVIKMRVFGASNLASTMFALGRKQEAVLTSEEGIELAKRMRIFDNSIRALQLEAGIHGEYALELYALGRVTDGDNHARITLNIRRELSRKMPGSYEVQRMIPVAQRPLGEALQELGEQERACAYYKEAIEEWARVKAIHSEIRTFDQLNEVDWLRQRITSCP